MSVLTKATLVAVLLLAYISAPLLNQSSDLYQVVRSGDAYAIGMLLNRVFDSLTTQSHIAVFDPAVALKSYNLQAFKSQSTTILQEFNTFRATHKVPTFGQLDPDQEMMGLGPWQTAWLRLYGMTSCVATMHFPQTLAAVRDSQLPAVSIMVSVLNAGQSLPVHEGPTRAVLRYHLGLSIPTNPAAAAAAAAETTTAATTTDGQPFLRIWPCRKS
mmetsp:Transcript_22645/g.49161  ORF Transcript_22645/g.49161 Transcript_22645/m.49161 type:complete len:215 (+) Transcript_22645:44-688(+)